MESNTPKDSIVLDRRVKIIEYEPSRKNGSRQCSSFRDFLEVPNIVLLGDPGAGKTHLFDLASRIDGGVFTTARQFSIYGAEVGATTLYVDALDEYRTRRDQHRVIDDIVRKLLEVRPQKLRISCRAIDWLGTSDLEVLSPYFSSNGGVAVLALEHLRSEEAEVLLHGLGENNPSGFIDEAKDRGLSDFISNPQSLTMLWEVVRSGDWPRTKLELNNEAIRVLLKEHSGRRHGVIHGQFDQQKLRDAAGAISASILISDCEGVSVDQNSSEFYPNIPASLGSETEIIIESLSRRVFTAHGLGKFTYAHRTQAEYLAAEWLANQVRSGYPVGRLRGLFGFGGVPCSELRGLHAWLSILLPEHAESLIRSDPWGTLVYGDIASISPKLKHYLFEELVKLSSFDPWFRRSAWSAEPLGALSCSELQEEFKIVLREPGGNEHLKSVVLDALASGVWLPALQSDLEEILGNDEEELGNRIRAFRALGQDAVNGRATVLQVYRDKLIGEIGSIEIRCVLIMELFEECFDVGDVVTLYTDLLSSVEVNGSSMYRFCREIPQDSVPSILDGLCTISLPESGQISHDSAFHFGSSLFSFLEKALFSMSDFDGEQLWKWLDFSSKFRMNHGGPEKGERIKEKLDLNQDILLDILTRLAGDEKYDSPYTLWHDFRSATLGAFDVERLFSWLLFELEQSATISNQLRTLYELSLWLALNYADTPKHQWETLLEIVEGKPGLEVIADGIKYCDIPEWRVTQSIRMRDRAAAERQRRNIDGSKFDESRVQIRQGEHLGWLSYLAKVYWSKFSDVNDQLDPKDRIKQIFGSDYVEDAVSGFIAILSTSSFPTPAEVARLDAGNKHFEWWFAALAGAQELWTSCSDLGKIDNIVLDSLIAISTALPTTKMESEGEWLKEIYRTDPARVVSIYEEMSGASVVS